MRPIYLIRHASPQIQPELPARAWPLSKRGIDEARALAGLARGWGLQALYTSAEPKARATALLVAEATGLDVNVVDGLEELRFGDWIQNADQFGEAVRAILTRPDVAFRKAETASAAAARFSTALETIGRGRLPAAVVSHGRVLTAYLAAAFRLDDAFELWRSMPMPGWLRIDLDGPPPAGGFLGLSEEDPARA